MSKNNFLLAHIKSTFFWFAIACVTVIYFWPTLLLTVFLYPFDRTRKAIHLVISIWAKAVVSVCPLMDVSVEGEEHLNHQNPYILVCNHQSIADIIVALHLKHPFKFIAKKELFWIPFLGWSMQLAGYIPLVRGNQLSGKQALEKAKSYIQRGTSVLFFPEGTRSPDGEIHSFKAGAFKLAAETNVPVLPMVIDGTYNFIPKGTRIFSRTVKVKLTVLEPKIPCGTGNASIERFIHEVRSDMIHHLKGVRSRKEMELTSISSAPNLSI